MVKFFSISKEINAPIVATNDSHYVSQDQSTAHDALLCVQTNALIDDETRFRFEGEEYYLSLIHI